MSSIIVDQRAEAMTYMEEHKIMKLFDILGSRMAQQKPKDPNEFLLSELRRISELRATKQPVTLFSESDIDIMFSIFDLTNRGWVTQTQYLKALNAVGISNPVNPIPQDDKIDRKTFVNFIYAEVLKDSF